MEKQQQQHSHDGPCNHEHHQQQPSAEQPAEQQSAAQADAAPSAANAAPQTSKLVDFFYRLETYMKVYFLVTSLMGWRDATTVGLFSSLLGLFRMIKRPQFNQEYLKKFLTNQFGLNIVYFLMLAAQQTPRTYLFYAPVALHYFLGIVEFLNLKHKDRVTSMGLQEWVDAIRGSRKAILVYKGKLEFFYEMLLLCSLPFDLGLILSVVMLGQCLLLKHKITEQFKWTMYDINGVLRQVLGPIPGVSFLYDKLCLALSKM